MNIKSFFPQKLKNCYHLLEAIVANAIYGFPSQKIKVIGVTGTNGKTTTVQMIAGILEEAGHKVAVSSTINFKLGDKEWVNKTKFTTLSGFAVQNFLKKAIVAGCQYAILETSSHALDQNRIWGVRYVVAVITNVTREHLDYHKNMDSYRLAKCKMFKRAKTAVVNLDMKNWQDFWDIAPGKKIGFTTKENQRPSFSKGERIIRTEKLQIQNEKSSFEIEGISFIVYLPGIYNVENALGAISVATSQGINLEISSKALEKIKGIPGRMEKVSNNRGIEIIVDYAVTPDSLEKLYSLVSKTKKEKSQIIAVFGSCGDRDRGKRPIMGKIVNKYADYIIVTNEDPYGEDPINIINEVFGGVVGKKISNSQFLISDKNPNSNSQILNPKGANKRVEGENCWRILDRRDAIRFALKLARPGDIILVTGKGAEETMMLGKKMIPWNDRQVILEELKKTMANGAS